MKIGVLKNLAQFTEKRMCQSLFHANNFIKKKTLAQLFSCEFCESFKNTSFTEHLWMTVSFCLNVILWFFFYLNC